MMGMMHSRVTPIPTYGYCIYSSCILAIGNDHMSMKMTIQAGKSRLLIKASDTHDKASV